LRFPPIDVALVTVSAPETVTFPPDDGLRIILEVAEIWTLDPALIDMEPNEVV
jgi:hypothetical protein